MKTEAQTVRGGGQGGYQFITANRRVSGGHIGLTHTLVPDNATGDDNVAGADILVNTGGASQTEERIRLRMVHELHQN